jgi:hypothetical protein
MSGRAEASVVMMIKWSSSSNVFGSAILRPTPA